MAKYASYTKEIKDALVQKVLVSSSGSVKSISGEAGVPSSTLENWIKKYCQQKGGDMPRKKTSKWTAETEQLPEKERLVISLYYLDELTMKETGKVLNVTESRVSQIHSQAIMRLRAKLKKKS